MSKDIKLRKKYNLIYDGKNSGSLVKAQKK
ncbi:hypothetical protein LCGC14_1977290 [marine sediment metagenome]|uniref:Uncharacterized protein n=1 Tax=marine sediment metagenome TaxID=412755 RepID=A0A0F9FY42_9ZZZZ